MPKTPVPPEEPPKKKKKEPPPPTPPGLEPLTRITKDLRKAAATLSDREARYLVDTYYAMQDDRKRGANQVRALTASEEPHETMAWFAAQSSIIEKDIAIALDVYSGNSAVGQWARSVHGIGPILSAGLLAHIDIERTRGVSKLWRYAGLDPTSIWKKKTKRPWNASLKTLAWKIGESFMKVSGNDEAVYGKIYAERKVLELARNEAGAFAEQAAHRLKTMDIDKSTEAYKWMVQGKLSPGHILSRSKRYATKIFLSHYWQVAWWEKYKTQPPQPWIIAHGGHIDYMPPPNYTPPSRTPSDPPGSECEPY